MKNLYLVATNGNKYLIAASDRYTVLEAMDVNNTMSFGESIESVYDWQTFDWYSPFGDFSVGMIPRTLQGCPMRRECYAPTIGLALKWLREEKKIHVVIDIWGRTWGYDVLTLPSGISSRWTAYDANINSYEDAALDGIEYVLDNLI